MKIFVMLFVIITIVCLQLHCGKTTEWEIWMRNDIPFTDIEIVMNKDGDIYTLIALAPPDSLYGTMENYDTIPQGDYNWEAYRNGDTLIDSGHVSIYHHQVVNIFTSNDSLGDVEFWNIWWNNNPDY